MKGKERPHSELLAIIEFQFRALAEYSGKLNLAATEGNIPEFTEAQIGQVMQENFSILVGSNISSLIKMRYPTFTDLQDNTHKVIFLAHEYQEHYNEIVRVITENQGMPITISIGQIELALKVASDQFLETFLEHTK